MYSSGILIEQHLQCTQFWALMTNSSSGPRRRRPGKIRLWGPIFPQTSRRLAHHGVAKFVLHDQVTRLGISVVDNGPRHVLQQREGELAIWLGYAIFFARGSSTFAVVELSTESWRKVQGSLPFIT